MSSQLPIRGHFAISPNNIMHRHEPPLAATFPVSQGWLLITGPTLVNKYLIDATSLSMGTILYILYWEWNERLNIYDLQMFGLKLNKYE